MKKRKLCCILFLAVVSLLLFACHVSAASGGTVSSYELEVTYGQTEARRMLDMINQFRTGPDAWYWNSDNTTKTTASLQPLTYDYTLERIAMQRAAEIALHFEHTRTNGEKCYSLYPPSYWSAAENIAAGRSSAEATFQQWQETNEKYSGQGHRRNMLSGSVVAVGIGHVIYQGTHYWVQEFSNPIYSTEATNANDGQTPVSVEIASSYIKSRTLTASQDSLSIPLGQSVSLPQASLKLQLTNRFPNTACPVKTSCEWKLDGSGTGIAELSGGTLIGKSCGTTRISADFQGETLTVPVTVTPLSLNGAQISLTPGEYTYDGQKKTPSVRVELNGALLPSQEYSVAYSQNTDAGTGIVTVTGTGNYTGTASKTFQILPADLSAGSISALPDAAYTGAPITPEPSVIWKGRTLVKGRDYEVTYSNNRNPGSALVQVKGIHNFSRTLQASFQIQKSEDTPAPTATPTPAPGDTAAKTVKKGTQLKDKKTNGVYKVVKPGTSKTAEAIYQKPLYPSKTSFTIPDTIVIRGVTCKVTSISSRAFYNNRSIKKIRVGAYVKSIGKQAFYGCKSLRDIRILSARLKTWKVGSKAFQGISAKAVIRTPASKLSTYKKLLFRKGISKKTVVIKLG